MSKIRLHGSSSGYMEIAPPAAGSSATVTLPNSAGEILLSDGSAASLTQIPAANIVGVCTSGLTKTGGFGGGKTLQVQQTVKTDTASATAENTWEDISGMSVSITPSNSSNKIRVTAVCNVNSSHGTYWALRVVKDGSIFGAEGDAASSRTRCFGGFYDTENNYSVHCTVVDFLDTAGGTSAITYKVCLLYTSPSPRDRTRYRMPSSA